MSKTSPPTTMIHRAIVIRIPDKPDTKSSRNEPYKAGWWVPLPAGFSTRKQDRYRTRAKYSHALQTSQTCSFANWYPAHHRKVAFEAPCSCTHYGIKSIHDGILHFLLNECWKLLWIGYSLVTRVHVPGTSRYTCSEVFPKLNYFWILWSSKYIFW